MLLNSTLFATVTGQPTAALSDSDRDAVVVLTRGEQLTFSFDLNIGTIAASINRQPSGASATFTGGAITPNANGWYRFAVAMTSANAPRYVTVAVFPPDVAGPPLVLGTMNDLRLVQPNGTMGFNGWVADPFPKSSAQVREFLRGFVLEQTRSGVDLSFLDTTTPVTSRLSLYAGWNDYRTPPRQGW